MLKKEGVLIIDDLDDIRSCTFNPVIYLRNKLKMPLSEGETLKIVLISNKDDSVNTLFNNKISCDAVIKMPFITQKNEIMALIQSLDLEMDLSPSSVELKAKLTISKLKTILLTYCNTTKSEERTLGLFVSHLNKLYPSNEVACNSFRLFQNGTQKLSSCESDVTNSV